MLELSELALSHSTAHQADVTLIIGAGWSGLAAAVTLVRAGQKVILLEAAPQAGGRARKIAFRTNMVDNGQHVLIGAYTHTLTLLKWLNIAESDVFYRQPFEWFMLDLESPNKAVHLKKLSEASSFFQKFLFPIKIKGLSLKESFYAMRFLRTILKKNFELPQDVSVTELLVNFKQPRSLIKKIWEPMALAALSTPIDQASAQVFLHILKSVFTNFKSPYSDWLFPTTDLSTLLPDPCIQYVTNQGSSIFYNQRVQSLIIENGKCRGVKTATQEFYAKNIILATPPHVTAGLLKSQAYSKKHCEALMAKLLKFQYQPITTIYLRFQNVINLKKPIIGVMNATLHWIFDRRFAKQPDVLSVVITGKSAHTSLSHVELIEKLLQEIYTLFPSLNAVPMDYRVVTEKRAAFSCDIGINHDRPTAITPLPNLLLAGDYTQLHYPATLESAIQSGIKAAQLILSKHACFI